MFRLITRRAGRWTAHLLMICAFAAAIGRALVPVGYMPAREGDRISMILCGSGHVVNLDLGGDRAPGGRKVIGDGLCVFSGTPATPPTFFASVTAPRPDDIGKASPSLPRAARASLGLAAPPPPSHAPPFSA